MYYRSTCNKSTNMPLSKSSTTFCWASLLFLYSLARPSLAICPEVCVCSGGDAQIDCNGAVTGNLSIEGVVGTLRAQGMESSVTHLTFLGASEVILLADTFSGFTSLRQLTIQFTGLSQIEPGAFSGLSQLEALQLCENNFQWLSADLFAGIGSSLNTLELAGNQLQYLREDLSTFFSGIQQIDLQRNMFNCDCHLQWLAELLTVSPTQPTVEGAVCGTSATSITDASVDFSSCQDVCVLGFHNCHPSAICDWNMDTQQVTCTCAPGYAGDGMTCNQVCETELNICHDNATCQWAGTGQQVTCTCSAGFVGDGVTCTCAPGYVGDGMTCNQVCETELNICHDNATCQWAGTGQQVTCTCSAGFVGDGVTCTCAPGYIGDGMTCNQVCETELNSCHDNATCQWAGTGQQVTCTCSAGFVGDGVVCEPCQSLCSAGMRCVVASVSYCTCNDGYVLQGEECVQDTTAPVTCPVESAAGYLWPETVPDTTVRLPCTNQGDSPTVSRSCDGSGSWEGVVAPRCVSQTVQGLQQQLSLLQSDTSSDPLLIRFSTELFEAVTNVTFSGDVPVIVDLLQTAINLLSEANLQGDIPVSYENLVEVGSDLLDIENQALWLQLNNSEIAESIVGLFAAIDEIGQTLLNEGSVSGSLNISTNNIALLIFQPESSDNGTCEGEAISVSSTLLDAPIEGPASTLDLPASLLSDAFQGAEFECTDVGIVAVVYSGAGPLLSLEGANSLLPDTGCDPNRTRLANGMCMWYGEGTVCPMLQVNSVIISAVVVSNNENQTVDTSRLSEPILITLQHEDMALEDPVCTFLNEQEVRFQQGGSDVSWLTEGCNVLSTSSNTTVCQCFHLTSFALLMSPTGPPSANQPLHIASKVGLSVSIICLIITIILLFSLKLKEKLHHVHRQLALALCLSQMVFLVAVDRTSVRTPDWLCTTVAALMHYLLLCTFAWQLTEGIHLYLFVVKVFFNEKIIWAYYPFAWGLPLIIVAVTLGVRFCDYGSEYYCWISTGQGTNWAFHGPVIAVLLINIVILVGVTTVIVRASQRKEENACLFFTLLHASLVLVPILGVTWALGFFVVGDSVYSTIVEWLFFAFSSLQGVFIFIMHCLLNREVRVAFLKAVGCHMAARRQTTVMQQSRRLSTQTSFGSLLRQTFTRSAKSDSSLQKGYQMNKVGVAESSDVFSSGSLKNFITVQRIQGHRNPLALKGIDEESEIEASHQYNPSSSEGNTPQNGTPGSYKRTID